MDLRRIRAELTGQLGCGHALWGIDEPLQHTKSRQTAGTPTAIPYGGHVMVCGE